MRIVHILNFLITLTLLVPCSVPAQSQAFDVQEYDLTIRIDDPSTKFVRGCNDVRLKWTAQADSTAAFQFHARGYEIDSVLYDGNPVSCSSPDQSLGYDYKISRRSADDTAHISIYYSGEMTNEDSRFNWGGVHYADELLYAMGVGFFSDYVSMTRHWMPCYDHPRDKVQYSGTFIVPDTLTAISNGTLLEEKDTLQGMKTYHWSMSDPVATYLLTFAIGAFQTTEFALTGKDFPVRVYSYDTDIAERHAAEVFALVPEMVEAYEHYFEVPYPFEALDYYTASRGAMEHQTLITMSHDQVLRRAAAEDSLYLTAAHELSHQWFGDLVSPLNFKSAWLNEGFATYCEALWLEYRQGKNAYFDEVLNTKRDYLYRTIPREGPLPLHHYQQHTDNNYPQTIYNKGALILAMLRDKLGDELFDILHDYLTDNIHGHATTGEFISYCSGRVDTSFWEDWVYNSGIPHLNIGMEASGSQYSIHITQVQESERSFSVPLSFEIEYKNRAKDTFSVHTQSPDSTYTRRSNREIAQIRLLPSVYPFETEEIYFKSAESDLTLDETEVQWECPADSLHIRFPQKAYYEIFGKALNGEEQLLFSGTYEGVTQFECSNIQEEYYKLFIRQGDSFLARSIED